MNRFTACVLGLAALMATGSAWATAIRSPEDGLIVPIISRFETAQKVIEIDGRQVRLELVVQNNPFPTQGPDRGPRDTLVYVQVFSVDGDQLPQGLSVTKLRLQRVASPHRIIHTDLSPRAIIPEIIGFNEFGADDPVALVANTKFRAALRVEFNGRVQIVPMGVVRVQPAPLVNTSGE